MQGLTLPTASLVFTKNLTYLKEPKLFPETKTYVTQLRVRNVIHIDCMVGLYRFLPIASANTSYSEHFTNSAVIMIYSKTKISILLFCLFANILNIEGGWSPWSPCSVTCGGGLQRRINDAGQTEERECGSQPCPPRWSPWSPCSVTCGGGVQARANDAGQTETRECNTMQCHTDSKWSFSFLIIPFPVKVNIHEGILQN